MILFGDLMNFGHELDSMVNHVKFKPENYLESNVSELFLPPQLFFFPVLIMY